VRRVDIQSIRLLVICGRGVQEERLRALQHENRPLLTQRERYIPDTYKNFKVAYFSPTNRMVLTSYLGYASL
jgi:hypothetical protein